MKLCKISFVVAVLRKLSTNPVIKLKTANYGQTSQILMKIVIFRRQ